MNLFKKVLIVGLATMALGSAAMGETKLPCEVGAQDVIKAGPPPTGDAAAKQGAVAADVVNGGTPAPAAPQQ